MFPGYDDFDDDFDIPEYMQRLACNTVGCMKTRLSTKEKCLDCEVTANLPGLFSEMEQITKTGF